MTTRAQEVLTPPRNAPERIARAVRSRDVSIRVRFGWVFIVSTLAIGCSSPPPLASEALTEPALRRIHAQFAQAIAEAKNDPDVSWRSGWFGNFTINFSGDSERGLCYEWQGLVFSGVRETVERVGWRVRGISINRWTVSEHHAVVVWDPKRIEEDGVLEAEADDPAYVLDAWKRGEADIWRLSDWVRLPLFVRVEPALETPYPGTR